MKHSFWLSCSIALAGLLSGCGSSSDGDKGTLDCSALSGHTLAARELGLPSGGARITHSELIPAGGEGIAAHGDYCAVHAEIAPLTSTSPPIRVLLGLPTDWNGKALMLGGSGFSGSLPAITGPLPMARPDVRHPLGQGYVVFGSDSGHVAGALGPLDASFALDDEALQNFAGDAIKKTHDLARAVIAHHYAAEPQRMYFAGGSTGGREALVAVQQWPTDWDGVLAFYPAWNAASLNLQIGRVTRAMAAPGAWPDPEQRRALLAASLEACDGLDGLADGLVSDVATCNARFDPATATVAGQPLRCATGEQGEHCLTDTQLDALGTYASRFHFPTPLSSGETSYPGFNLWGADLGLPGDQPLQVAMRQLGFGDQPPASPMPLDAPYFGLFWEQVVRYFITRDPEFDSLSLDPADLGPWQARLQQLAVAQDANRTDLAAFRARGGKLLMAHGQADLLAATQATAEYYERLRATMGAAAVQDFVRYYEIPGYGHMLGTLFNAGWDSLAALENWVERGIAPTHEVVIDSVGVPGRGRPLCDYPKWPHYDGGDPDRADSFSCVMR